MLGDYFKVYKEAALRLYEFSLLVLIYEENHEFIQFIHDVNFIDFNTAVHFLESKGYIKRFGSKPTDIMLRKAAESMFKEMKPKGTKKEVTEREIKEWFEEWREIFPPGVNNAGYRYRGNRLEGLKKMVKFVNLYPYTREEIFKATENYVKRFALKGYMYMQMAHFFIEKQGVGSNLASECEGLREKAITETKGGIHEPRLI